MADIISKQKTTQQVSFADEQVDTMKDVSMARMFLSKNIHYSTKSEDLREILGLSISQAALTLKATTQKLTISAIIPLTRRYRADCIFDVHRIYWAMYANTMDARCQSIHDENYCQLFGNKQFFAEAFTAKKKSNCHLGLDKFVKEYGAPDKMTYDGAQEQIGRKNKPNIELWEDLAGDDKIFHEEFSRVITNEDIPEADNIFDPEEFYNYFNMELALDRHDD